MKVLIGTTNPSKADWLGGLIGAGTELLPLHAEKLPSHGQAHSAAFRVPPLSVSIYRYQRTDPRK